MSEIVRPTKKQREILSYIETFIAEHGYSPSYREIMNGLQYTSVATVSLHVTSLIKRGHLRKRDHSARSLEVVDSEPTAVATKTSAPSSSQTWLIEAIRAKFASASIDPTREQLAELDVLIRALQILGLGDEADKCMTQLNKLRATDASATDDDSRVEA